MKPNCRIEFTSVRNRAIGLRALHWVTRGALIPAGQSAICQGLFDGPAVPVDAFSSIASASAGQTGGEVQWRICTLCNEHGFTIDHYHGRGYRQCRTPRMVVAP